MKPGLFRSGYFRLHSGGQSEFKIDCDQLSDDDLRALALIGRLLVRPFGDVLAIPSGGTRFARQMLNYATEGPTLLVDDVLTTGQSMRDAWTDSGRPYFPSGLVIFARGPCPFWVTPIFSMTRGAA